MSESTNRRLKMSRGHEKPRRTHGVTSSCMTFFGFVLIPTFVIMTLLNFGVTLLRLKDHHEPTLEATTIRTYYQNEAYGKFDVTPRPHLPPSIWSTRKLNDPVDISALLSSNETAAAKRLCGKLIYSTLQRAVRAGEAAENVFVETGDIQFMWIRDSVVQMSIYLNHHIDKPWLRFLIEGAIRKNAFNILQDPYANAYYHEWKDPNDMTLKDLVIGRGGFVATRNYELDSGAYFLCHLYDYYVAEDIYRPDALLAESMIFEAVLLMIETWIVEQHHEEKSPYRYFELPREGRGTKTGYTGMTWSGFRPSDDACKYGYHVPANIHAAAALERVLSLNEMVWKHKELDIKASRLLADIEEGIRKHGIVSDEHGNTVYAYEVDGLGGALSGFDDANIPSLLSIPLLRWSGYNQQVYQATRKKILSNQNSYYFKGAKLQGIGSPHTPTNNVWPMALVVEGLTEEGNDRATKMAFQMRQLLLTACRDAMHESNNVDTECKFTRTWFEWANALFVLYTEATLGVKCDAIGSSLVHHQIVKHAQEMKTGAGPAGRDFGKFYKNPYHNDPSQPKNYQGVIATVPFEKPASGLDVTKKIKNEVISAIHASREKQNRMTNKRKEDRDGSTA